MQGPGSKRRGRCHRLATRAVLLGAVLLLSACNQPFKIPEPPPAEPVAEQPPAPPPEAAVAPAPVVKPRPVRPPPPVPAAPPAEPRPVAILVSSQASGYQAVADALSRHLSDREYHVYQMAEASADPGRIFHDIQQLGGDPLVVAIGLPAASAVSKLHAGDAVFCQVFNHQAEDLDLTRLRGVAAFAPLDLQLQAWKEMSPRLARVGAILGPGHEDLVADANAAAAETGLQLDHRVAGSDREALYIFKRMAPDLDGLWLFPDNRVLSASVIRELLAHALRRNVQVMVFNPSLLKLGALMSAATDPDDVALTLLQVLDALSRGDLESLPLITTLSRVDLAVNSRVAERFGLTIQAGELQLVRSPEGEQ